MKKIFYNGTILTMEPSQTTPAVCISGGTIESVGTLAQLQLAAEDAELVDLSGKTMLPAFLDPHGHLSAYASAQLQVSLDGAASWSEIAQRIAAFRQTHSPAPGAWISAKGYDHNALAEKQHPPRELLDRLSPENPLMLQHQSGHCGAVNSAALAQLGITTETPDPLGGVIGRKDGALTGYLEEEAYIGAVKRVPMADMDALLAAYAAAQSRYLAYGITTVQEGMMVAELLPLYGALLARNVLTLDVVGYPDMGAMADFRATFPEAIAGYDRHLKIGGYKIILDGSPQVKTAWMKTPYRGGDDCGYGTMSDGAVLAAVERSVAEGVQLLAHCNGDAAIEQFISAVAQVAAKTEGIRRLKPVIIHGQFMTQAQLVRAAELGIIPSFFLAHVLHWGDIHVENVGKERAQSISPLRSALACGLAFTLHQDAPVIEPNVLETVQCAVTRRTKSGQVLGGGECISVEDALMAVTLNVARQYSEEAHKGSIRPGKHADFVILSDNPLTVPPEKIAEIAVLETIKDGVTRFRRDGR